MRSIALFLLFLGFSALAIGYANQIQAKPKTVVEYRYVPRTFEEEQNDPPLMTDVFRTMFDGQQPYMYGIGPEPIPKIDKSKVYQYNVAQY